MAPETPVKPSVLRNGEQKSLDVTLGVMPDEAQTKAEPATASNAAPAE